MSTIVEQEICVKTQLPEEDWFEKLSISIEMQRENMDEVEGLARNLINVGDFCCVH